VHIVRSTIGKKTSVYSCFILFSIIFLGIVFALILQLNPATADQSYYEPSVKMISSETMSSMSNMSGMHGMTGMSNMSGMHGMTGMSNMSGMHGMTGMSNMSGMHGMTGMLGISSNEESIFLECMFISIAGLVGIPFAWVIISERRKKLQSN
jgi:hypothetical protein